MPVGCRSDEGLSAPVISRLKKIKSIRVASVRLEPGAHCASYETVTDFFADVAKPDLVLIFGDRVEMCGAAAASFHNHVPIAHVYAGTGSNIATLDDINRHVITLWSDIQFCESELAANRVRTMCLSVGKPVNTHVVGITHLDDLEISKGMVIDYSYDLVLYNPPTYCNKKVAEQTINKELAEVEGILSQRTIFVEPNPDEYRYLVNNFIESHMFQGSDSFMPSLPRPQFLGLLKNCKRFITNSSAAIYEAPYFLKPEQIVHIGERNMLRDKGPFQVGASDKIVKVIEEWCTAKSGETTGRSQT